MQLSKRVQNITPSSTLAITAKAKALKAAGHDVIGLGAGEPDFNTPEHIIEAATLSMKEGETKYTPSGGLTTLKDAIIDKFKQDQQLTYIQEEIMVASGAKHALYTIFQALLDEGDEVIVPAPYWVSYPEQIKLAGGEPIFLQAKEADDFKISKDALSAAITSKTKAFIVNSPSNPTGGLYTKEELQALGEVATEHDVMIISDEIYEKLIYGDVEHHSIASLSDELKKRTVIVNGVSKAYSMTGWRIGYAAGDKALIKAMTDLASHSTSNPTTPAQYGAIAAYQSDQAMVEEMRQAFESRLEKAYEQLIQLPGVSCVKPKGAFYLFPNVKEAAEAGGFATVDEWAGALLDEEKVAVVPGAGFGAPDNIRLSYATSLSLLEEALQRIGHFIKRTSAARKGVQ
ncbi:pyridoxal phosphate-dependent aminotransferase [Natribacillus halophilus]|uniref:Aminotransferase n=1 Tax=Natribacillus halophilus TaxID=549003 RepID=A0A1G8JA11_9BACI|nr:pyridoxal phosphate-dependent aminotransferase [Natribacillus halophilus]SDI28108.1 L-aspartate aminotransferase apoenzyme [Natribacillus halophilus]